MTRIAADSIPELTDKQNPKDMNISVVVSEDFYNFIEAASNSPEWVDTAKGNKSGLIRLIIKERLNYTGDIGMIKDNTKGGDGKKQGDMLLRAILNSKNQRLIDAVKSGDRQSIIDLLTKVIS